MWYSPRKSRLHSAWEMCEMPTSTIHGALGVVESTSTFWCLQIFTDAPKFYSKFSQKFKNWGFKNSSHKMTKKCARFRAQNSILEFNDNTGYFDMYQGDSKKPPHTEVPKSWGWLNPQCAVKRRENGNDVWGKDSKAKRIAKVWCDGFWR